ncbi:MAG TPA: NHL repeat-containing protein [Acidisarcina sp.]
MSKRWLSTLGMILLTFGLAGGMTGCASRDMSGGATQAPVVTSFAATPAAIGNGDATTLTWSVTGATSIALTSSGGAVSGANSIPVTSSSLLVTPATTTTYTLVATNAIGTSTPVTTTVTVVDLPVISSFTAAPALIAAGQSTILNITVANVAMLSIDNGIGIVPVTGSTVSIPVTPSGTTTYTATATNAANKAVVATTTVTVIAAPRISFFKATPEVVASGQPSDLTYSVIGATSISISGIGTVPLNGAGVVIPVVPSVSTIYTLTASNSSNGVVATSQATATVTISACPPPTISSFNASLPSVGPGGNVTLTAVFDSTLGQTASIDNGVGAVMSGVSVPSGPLSASTTFTLTVSGTCGDVTTQVRVLAGNIVLFAGQPSFPGTTDGLAANAQFNRPQGIAIDSLGNLFIADTNSNTIRKITPTGAVSTLAGTGTQGSADGTGTAASFNAPMYLAVDAADNVYVSDTGNNTIRMITAAGVVTTVAGTPGVAGSLDGAGPSAQFSGPAGIAVDGSANLFVVDSGNDTIRQIAPGGVVTTLAGMPGMIGQADGTGPAALFNGPVGIAVDSSGTLYVADAGNDTVREIMSGGVVSTLAGKALQRGSTDANGAAASFRNPSSVAVDAEHNLYVADQDNYTIRRISPIGDVITIVGTAQQPTGLPGGPLPGMLSTINAIAVGPTSMSDIYISMQNALFTAPY